MKHVLPALLIVAVSLLMGCATMNDHYQASHSAGDQLAYQLQKEVSVEIEYQLFLPQGYDANSDKEWPLIFFLHGAGERGDDPEKVTVHGPPKLVKSDPGFPYIVVSPQCSEGKWWESATLLALLDDIIENYNINTDRIYLTGLSMGGFGTWNFATAYPERFAAIAPICGGGQPRLSSWRLAKTPIWVFHGAKDSVVPLAQSQTMVDAVRKAGGDVKFTIYPDANHDSWTETYDNPELYSWFMSHRLSDRN